MRTFLTIPSIASAHDRGWRRLRAFVAFAALLISAPWPAAAQVTVSGFWNPIFDEDFLERIPGPEVGDYLGLPINDAARLRADSWDASLLSLPEHQCKP